jgi:hypothetical protein
MIITLVATFTFCVALVTVPLPEFLKVGRHAKGYRW